MPQPYDDISINMQMRLSACYATPNQPMGGCGLAGEGFRISCSAVIQLRTAAFLMSAASNPFLYYSLFALTDMAEALAALEAIGLASNLLQFIDTAIKIYKSAYGNLSGLSEDLDDAGKLTITLREHASGISTDVDRCTAKTLSANDQRIVEIARQCRHIAGDLLKTLEEYEVQQNESFRGVRVAVKAIRATWNRNKIKDTEKLLEKYHRQLMDHLLSSYR